jgi:peroxiredoxin
VRRPVRRTFYKEFFMSIPHPVAPPWRVEHWFNTPQPITLESLRGKVVVLHAFQMLCPACVSHGLPQAIAIRKAFPEEAVAVIGMHTVFEHHKVMTHAALQAFIHENRLRFPIAVDMPSERGSIPQTMQEYQLQGTPSLVLIDRQGNIRLHRFGHVEDLVVGAAIGQLLTQ